jgi:CBS domain-containing protein
MRDATIREEVLNGQDGPRHHDPDCTCVGENDSLLDAARRLAELDVGALPICGEDNRLKGMLSDRDIVVKALAQGKRAPASSGRAMGRRSRSAPTTRSRTRCARWPISRCAGCR